MMTLKNYRAHMSKGPTMPQMGREVPHNVLQGRFNGDTREKGEGGDKKTRKQRKQENKMGKV